MARPYIGGTSGGVESIDSAKTITSADHGKVFMVTNTAGGGTGYTITLPTPAEAGIGFSCKFMNNCAANDNLADGGSDDVMLSSGLNDVLTVKFIDAGDAGAVSVVHDAQADAIGFNNTSVKGDYIEMFTDGVTWHAFGISGVSDGIRVDT